MHTSVYLHWVYIFRSLYHHICMIRSSYHYCVYVQIIVLPLFGCTDHCTTAVCIYKLYSDYCTITICMFRSLNHHSLYVKAIVLPLSVCPDYCTATVGMFRSLYHRYHHTSTVYTCMFKLLYLD